MHTVSQFESIFKVLGSPTDAQWSRINNGDKVKLLIDRDKCTAPIVLNILGAVREQYANRGIPLPDESSFTEEYVMFSEIRELISGQTGIHWNLEEMETLNDVFGERVDGITMVPVSRFIIALREGLGLFLAASADCDAS